jgi:hypothetical protein
MKRLGPATLFVSERARSQLRPAGTEHWLGPSQPVPEQPDQPWSYVSSDQVVPARA